MASSFNRAEWAKKRWRLMKANPEQFAEQLQKIREYKRLKARERRAKIYADPIKRAALKEANSKWNKARWARLSPKERAKRSAAALAWQHANPERKRAHSRDTTQRAKADVMAAYGNQCSCCGEKTMQFLTIDHINGGGRKHRSEIKYSLYFWLRKHGYPEGFRILCANCHLAVSCWGLCPHQS